MFDGTGAFLYYKKTRKEKNNDHPIVCNVIEYNSSLKKFVHYTDTYTEQGVYYAEQIITSSANRFNIISELEFSKGD